MRNGGFGARGVNQRLAEVTGAELAQTEFGGAEVVDAGGKTRRILDTWDIFTGQIGADEVEFDFVESAGAGGGAKKSFSLFMLLAANDSGGEEQELGETCEIGDGFHSRVRSSGRNGGKRGGGGFVEIPGEPDDFERGIDLEQEWLVVPVKKVRTGAEGELRMFGAAVVLPGGVEMGVL